MLALFCLSAPAQKAKLDFPEQKDNVIVFDKIDYFGTFWILKENKVKPLILENKIEPITIKSITVPNGFVAIIYEFLDARPKVSGRSVELLEDCKDLSVFGLKSISAIEVFKANKTGYFWVRGQWQGNSKTRKFMPGHWERVRANGENPNPKTPSVSPAISPKRVLLDY